MSNSRRTHDQQFILVAVTVDHGGWQQSESDMALPTTEHYGHQGRRRGLLIAPAKSTAVSVMHLSGVCRSVCLSRLFFLALRERILKGTHQHATRPACVLVLLFEDRYLLTTRSLVQLSGNVFFQKQKSFPIHKKIVSK